MGRRQDLIGGIVLGAIPLAAGYIAVGLALNNNLGAAFISLQLTLGLYVLWWVLMLALASSGKTTAAKGMVAALIASPVIYFVSCTVLRPA